MHANRVSIEMPKINFFILYLFMFSVEEAFSELHALFNSMSYLGYLTEYLSVIEPLL
jgi:hypothetical protein